MRAEEAYPKMTTLAKEKEVDEQKKETKVCLDQNIDLHFVEAIMGIIKKRRKKSESILILKRLNFGGQKQ